MPREYVHFHNTIEDGLKKKKKTVNCDSVFEYNFTQTKAVCLF